MEISERKAAQGAGYVIVLQQKSGWKCPDVEEWWDCSRGGLGSVGPGTAQWWGSTDKRGWEVMDRGASKITEG